MKEYVIIGNGIAAAGCIEGIRSTTNEGRITVISHEKYPVYCRPLISYYLEGRTKPNNLGYREENFYEKNGCTVLYGKDAVSIDADKKTVTLDDGTSLPYDSLCVAAGSSPLIPKFDGIETVKNKFSFMTLDDMYALEKAVTKNTRVLIIGAGLIGLKCAEGLHERAASITVCDLADRILSSIFDDEASGIMKKVLTDNGIQLMLSDSAVKFDGNCAFMKSGKKVEFDVLVIAVGVKANTSLVSSAGGLVNRGIIVNERLQTSLPDVYAAGDCTEGMDISSDTKRVLAILPNAYMQGKCAGINMTGNDAKFDNAIPMNSIGIFGYHAMTGGSYYTEEKGGTVYAFRENENLRKFFCRDGYLSGFILIGSEAIKRAGIYTSLIRDKTPLDSVDFDLLVKEPTFAAFSQNVRRKKFGGMV